VSELGFIDPSKFREERRARAAEAAAVASKQRIEDLRAAEAAERSKKPQNRDSRALPTYGSMDAVSVPIYEEHGPKHFMAGPSNDFLYPVGAGQDRNSPDGAVPRQLRQGGWVYLRAGGKLVARVVFTGIERRTSRIEHVRSAEGYLDAGPGPVLAVDANTWELCDIPLESASESGNGYRYYMMDGDRPVFTTVT
jgi:hypothetical protein